MNEGYVCGWLYRRLDWEDTLAELHVRARLAREAEVTESVASPNGASDEPPARVARERRVPARRWSPIRGMSLRRSARKLRV
jgi:hypothetical protein